MSPRKAAAIRRILDLPRLARDMTSQQRALYRSAKRKYNRLPAPARAAFLDDVTELKHAFVRASTRRAGALNTTGAPSTLGNG